MQNKIDLLDHLQYNNSKLQEHLRHT